MRYDSNHVMGDRLFALGSLVGYGFRGPAGFVVGVDLAVFATSLFNTVFENFWKMLLNRTVFSVRVSGLYSFNSIVGKFSQ